MLTKIRLLPVPQNLISTLGFAGVALARQLAFAVSLLLLGAIEGAGAVGRVSINFAVLMVCVGVSDFGLRQLGWQRIAAQDSLAERARTMREILDARLATVAAATGLYLACGLAFDRLDTSGALFWLLLVGVPFNSVSLDFVYLGIGRQGFSNQVFSASWILFGLANAAFLAVGLGETAFAMSFALAMVGANGWLWAKAHEFVPGWLQGGGDARPRSTATLRIAVPMASSRVLERLVNNAPLLTASILGLSTSAIGRYRLAEMAYAIAAMMGIHYGSASFRRLVRSGDGGDLPATLLHLGLLGLGLGSVLALCALSFASWYFEHGISALLWLSFALVPALPNRYLRVTILAVAGARRLLHFNVLHLSCLVVSIAASVQISEQIAPGVLAGELLTLGPSALLAIRQARKG